MLIHFLFNIIMHMQGYKGSVDYIASQGPMEETVIDFWCMIWEQEISQVVMLTNTEEKGRVCTCF